MIDITKDVGLDYLHKENRFVEFDREPLDAAHAFNGRSGTGSGRY